MVKILIVDDESFMRDLIRKALKMISYSDIVEAVNGEEAIRKFKENKPDVVFLDLKLPDMHGGKVLKVFHKNKKINSKCKIIIVSTVAQEEMGQNNQLTLKEAKELGAVSWVIKPITPEKIIIAVREALNKLN